MKVLISQATIIDPYSPFHLSQQDIIIEDGIIRQIQESIIEQADNLIDLPGLCISPGWIDVFANFCDPGFEQKETLETGADAAAAGGFTTVMVIPNTKPVVDSKVQVEYIARKSKSLPVRILPVGAITKNAEGKELAEMYDMQNSGAVCFSDGSNPVQSAGMLVKALQYIRQFDGVIIQIPDDKSLSPHGLMNEGIVSTRLGLPGKPVMAEELVVARDIKLAGYTGSRIHFTALTSPDSLKQISKAKAQGIRATCSVTPFHLYFCDEDLAGYDTNLKVNPPLRSRSDMMGLREAVQNGLVDCIATHHEPQDYDAKVAEFEYARHGMTSLETCYSVLKTVLPQLSETKTVELLSLNAAKIFGISKPAIDISQKADCTLFQPAAGTSYSEKNVRSKSKNSPFLGKHFNGSVAGIVQGGHVILNQSRQL